MPRTKKAEKIEVLDSATEHPPTPTRSTNAIDYWWRWKAKNGEIRSCSETYPDPQTARKCARSAWKCIAGALFIDHTKPTPKG